MSTCPQAGSMFDEGIWNTQNKAWNGGDIAQRRVMRLIVQRSSLGRLPCKPWAVVCNQSCAWPVPPLSCAFCT